MWTYCPPYQFFKICIPLWNEPIGLIKKGHLNIKLSIVYLVSIMDTYIHSHHMRRLDLLNKLINLGTIPKNTPSTYLRIPAFASCIARILNSKPRLSRNIWRYFDYFKFLKGVSVINVSQWLSYYLNKHFSLCHFGTAIGHGMHKRT